MKTLGLWCLLLVILLVAQDADACGRGRAPMRQRPPHREAESERGISGRRIVARKPKHPRLREEESGRETRRGIDFVKEAAKGARDMWRANKDMRDANFKGADKYFHARGNYDAQKHGPGGKWAAEKISNAREGWQVGISGRGAEDSAADQEANLWGRNGGDPNRYRPEDLPSKY